MSDREEPWSAQDYAAPDQRLWPVMAPGSECPATDSASLNVSMKALAVKGRLSEVMNDGPSTNGRVLDT